MKKIIVYSILLICSITVNAQINDTISLTEFQTLSSLESKNVNEAIKNKVYDDALTGLNKMVDAYFKLSEKNQKGNPWFPQNMYFYLSYFNSIQGKKEPAIDYFDKALAHGYKNYGQIKNDTVFDKLRDIEKFQKLMVTLQERGDYLYILKNSGTYKNEDNKHVIPKVDKFADTYLAEIRKELKLDSIAGNGDEISKIINLLNWAHNAVPHDGNNGDKIPSGAVEIYKYTKNVNKGVHCGALSEFMKECYLAMDFDAHRIVCLPKDTMDFDCHSINQVYSKTLKKWIWIDPTNNAYVKDDNGNLLSIQDVRYRLKNNLPVSINDDANWNNKSKVIKEQYIDNYMAKNLYWFRRWIKDNDIEYKAITLLPTEFELNPMEGDYRTNDENYFWGNN